MRRVAGVAAGLGLLAGVSRYLSIPWAAIGVSLLVLRGSFHRVEQVLLALASVFVAYVVSRLLAPPDWRAIARGLVVAGMPLSRDSVLEAVATLGTTLAPWGLAFIRSYAVDKRLTVEDLRYERVDVIGGRRRRAARFCATGTRCPPGVGMAPSRAPSSACRHGVTRRPAAIDPA